MDCWFIASTSVFTIISIERTVNAVLTRFLKDTPSAEIAAAILAVALGYTHLAPGMIDKLMSGQIDKSEITLPPELTELTPRELEILKLIAGGSNNREIAGQLYISEGTVKNHVTNILTRLNVRDRTQAAILAKTYLII